MRNIIGAALVAITLAACGDDDSSGPSTSAQGLRLVAEVTQNLTFFSTTVTVTNTTNATITRSISLACPVGIQFLAIQGDAIVYDESAREGCSATNALTLAAGQSVTLTSGSRYIPTITETVAPNTYRVRALVRFAEGEQVLVDGGTWRLPSCRQQGMGTICE